MVCGLELSNFVKTCQILSKIVKFCQKFYKVLSGRPFRHLVSVNSKTKNLNTKILGWIKKLGQFNRTYFFDSTLVHAILDRFNRVDVKFRFF